MTLEDTLHAISRENTAAHGELDAADVDRVVPGGAFRDLQSRIALLVADRDRLRDERDAFSCEVASLDAIINTPRTDEFFEAVRLEAAHQIERWGVEHDAGKRPEDWLTLYTYLLGKAARAHFDGDREKLLHHIITVAAVALNWHRNETGVSTLMRPGVAPEVGHG